MSIVGNNVNAVHSKGHINFDLIHIGLIGIYDFKSFWSIANKILKEEPNNQTLGDVDVLKTMIISYKFKIKEFSSWNDVGSVKGLMKARKKINNREFHVLDKLAESIYKLEDYYIKFFSDPNISNNRVQREKFMSGTIPKIIGSRENFYKYKSVEGKLFSEFANRSNFISLLNWSEKNLWRSVLKFDLNKFKEDCKNFYYDKTISRINDFYSKKNIQDCENIINGEHTPKLFDLLKLIDFNELCSDKPTNFHGDFILDNIIMTNSGDYKLIDWRQDFSGNLEAGDKYYDLAKLAHNLVVNHSIIDKDLFKIEINNNEIEVNINRIQTLVDCENIYFKYLEDNNYSLKKVRLLRAIIWLNMSPLHHHPFDLFLYYYGKYELSKVINDYK